MSNVEEDVNRQKDKIYSSETGRALVRNMFGPKDANKIVDEKQIEHIKNNLSSKDFVQAKEIGVEEDKFKFPTKRKVSISLNGKLKNKILDTLQNELSLKEEVAKPKEPWYNNPYIKSARKCVTKFIDSTVVTVFMLSITIFVLFASDVKTAFLHQEVDSTFTILQAVFFGFFSLEIILASLAQDGYVFSFFFWLDLVSTLSLIQEIDFIFEPLINSFTGGSSKGSKGTAQKIAKAASAGRVTRVLRVIRIIRLIRIVKLYKSTIQARKRLADQKKERLLKSQNAEHLHSKKPTKSDKVANKAFEEFNNRVDTLEKEKINQKLSAQNLNQFNNQTNIIIVDGKSGNVLNNYASNEMLISKLDGRGVRNKNNNPDSDLIGNQSENLDQKTFRFDTIEGKLRFTEADEKPKDHPLNILIKKPLELNVVEEEIRNEGKGLDDGHYNTMIKFKDKTSIDINDKEAFLKNENHKIGIDNNELKADLLNLKDNNSATSPTKDTRRASQPVVNIDKTGELKEETDKNTETTKKTEDVNDIVKESEISKRLLDAITKKLIILILGMVVGLTVISEEMWIPDTFKHSNIIPLMLEDLELYGANENGIVGYDYSQSYYVHTQYGDLSFKCNNFTSTDVNPNIIKDTQTVLDSYNNPTTRRNLISIFDDDYVFNETYLKSTFGEGNYAPYLDTMIKVNISDKNVTDYILSMKSTTVNNKLKYLPYIYLRNLIYRGESPFNIINITYRDQLIFFNETASDYIYRDSEVSFSYSNNEDFLVTTSILIETKLSGILNIVKTLFITLLIVAGAIVFENDTKMLVLDPLEIMIEIVEMVEQDPVIAKNVKNLQMGVKNLANKSNDQSKKNKNSKKIAENSDKYEVIKIQNSIVKISGLLAICFGEAGGEVIKKNLEKGKEFNPMLPGQKKSAIFGFCDIRYFEHVNNALQERTVIFVNQISEIVHSSVDKFSGATNKNIGDAYLSAWRFSKKIETEDGLPIVKPIKCEIGNPEAALVADQSVLSFLQILIKINSDKDILSYRTDVDIVSHHNLKNYQVKMGFGLHIGWAIEGSIGSTYKIDASYLSPNVNISARLEAATKQYGVYLLISGELYDMCSEDIQCICRLIDVVAVKGSIKPIRLYTVDVNIYQLPIDNKVKNPSVKRRFEKLQEEKEIIQAEGKRQGNLVQYVLQKPAFKRLLKLKRPKEFLPVFNSAIDNYIKGDWRESGRLFEKCMDLDPLDGPTKTLYEYIKGENFTAPSDWEGFRSLTSK